MTSVSQKRGSLRSAALFAAIFLMAAPAALADPAGSVSDVGTAAVVAPSNAPKPGASFLSGAHAFDALENSPAFDPSGEQGLGGDATPVQ